jgi:hypothetical protein
MTNSSGLIVQMVKLFPMNSYCMPSYNRFAFIHLFNNLRVSAFQAVVKLLNPLVLIPYIKNNACIFLFLTSFSLKVLSSLAGYKTLI